MTKIVIRDFYTSMHLKNLYFYKKTIYYIDLYFYYSTILTVDFVFLNNA